MNRLLTISIFCVMIGLCACTNKPDAAKNNADVSDADTLIKEYWPWAEDYDYKIKEEDSIIFIDSIPFTLALKAEIDTFNKFSFSETYTKEWKNFKNIYHGYNANYTVSLRDSRDKEIFTTIITKDHFNGVLDGMILTMSDVWLPDYLGYQKKFQSFLFTMWFWKPESDVGDQCFLMIDKSGEIKHLFWTNYFGGPNCKGDVEISEDGETILTCEKIIKLDGSTIDISEDSVTQVAVKCITNNCVLVIRDYNDKTKQSNAILMDNKGNFLQQFVYQGYFVDGLNYTIPMHFDSLSKSFYLLDEYAQNIRVIQQEQPLKSTAIAIKELERSGAAKMVREKEFTLYGNANEYTVLIDTLTHKIRMYRDI